MKRKIVPIVCAAAVLVLILLVGLLLLPEEEAPVSLAVLGENGANTYQTYSVSRGDLEQSVTISCKFQSLAQEHLRFEQEGQPVEGIYVEVGDSVEPGQLLAALKDDALTEELETARAQAQQTKLEMELAQSNLNIAYTYGIDYEQTAEYREQALRLEEDSALAEQRVQELEEQRKKECLYAGIQGTVTDVRPGDTSVSSSDTVVVSDLSDACFSAVTEYYELLKPGMEVELSTDVGQIAAVITDASDLGFDPAEENLEKGKRRVYFVPKLASTMLTEASQARLSLVLDSRKDVLLVPRQAVFFAGEQAYIYVEQENGVREAHPIEVGLLFNGQYEVLSGLDEGDVYLIV